jgi:hypothetical protein
MLFPFRASLIFRNRWIALLWAIGICFAASEIVDSLSGVSKKGVSHTAQSPKAEHEEADALDVALGNVPPRPKLVEDERIVR